MLSFCAVLSCAAGRPGGDTPPYLDALEYQNPLHPYTWGLWDAMPSLALEHKQELKTIPGTPPDLRLTGRCCNLYNRCPYAQEVCMESVPELVEVSPGHCVACHFQTAERKLERGDVCK